MGRVAKGSSHFHAWALMLSCTGQLQHSFTLPTYIQWIIRIRPSSTLQSRKRSPKTGPFENALQNGVIWKRFFLKTLFSSVDGENDTIWKRWFHQNRHDRALAHSTVSIQNGGQTLPCGFSLDRRYSVDVRKRYDDKCGRKSFWKRSKTAPFSFENGLVWTGPPYFSSQIFDFSTDQAWNKNTQTS